MVNSEQWLPVVGFEGFYEVSDQGSVRSLDRYAVDRNGRGVPYRGKTLSMHRHKDRGYLTVALSKAGKPKTYQVHQLVCIAFHGTRPEWAQDVRHLNDVKTDNRAENLRWGTRSENLHDAVRNGRHQVARRTHCKQGHEYTPENTQRGSKRQRRCRKCRADEYIRHTRRLSGVA